MLERLARARHELRAQIAQRIVGQAHVVDDLVAALLAGGHVVLIGVPGLAKTLLIQTVAQALDLDFSRVQFTPDLMPSDITGTELMEEESGTGRRAFRFQKGPIFGNIVLADEINRAPPKTQAALLQAMQERNVTVAGQTYELPNPFFVLATQNPIELEGTYPLPEAQLDRFLFNTVLDYLEIEEELKVISLTTTTASARAESITTGPEMLSFQELVRMVPISDSLARYAVALVRASRQSDTSAPDFVKNYVNFGASVRGIQNLVLASKARALMKGRQHVVVEDVQKLYTPILRHRILLNFKAESERLSTDDILARLLTHVPVPKE